MSSLKNAPQSLLKQHKRPEPFNWINKAKKGELRSPLPVGYVYDESGRTLVDPDKEVRGAINLLFDTFKELGSAYGVVHHYAKNQLKFPKRSYGGAWDGKLIWGNLVHGRVRGVLRNPGYAGAYVYGRYGYEKTITEDGRIQTKILSFKHLCALADLLSALRRKSGKKSGVDG